MQSVLATRDFSESPYLIFATRNGTVKKTAFQAYNTPIKADGIIAINIRDDDELVAVRRVDEDDEILMVSHAGLAVRFKESDARAMGRDTSGVRGMDVADKGNYVLAMDVARPGPGPAGRDRERLRQAHARSTSTGSPRAAPRASRRSRSRRPRACCPARWSSASTRSSSSSPRTAWSSGPACAGSTATAGPRRACKVMNLREGDVGVGGGAGGRERDVDRRRGRSTRSSPVDGAEDGRSRPSRRASARTRRDLAGGRGRRTRRVACPPRRFATLRITRERGWSEVE